MKTTKQHFERIKNIKLIENIRKWAAGHRKQSWAICAIIALCIGGLISFIVFSALQPADTAKKTTVSSKKKVEAIKYYSKMTGNLVANETAISAPVTGIMIENSPDARPQSGLKDSEILFEAIAEAGITRFIALFQQNKPQLIGPVRSVRIYYIDWAAAFNASIAHIGGSDEALAEVRNGNYRDLDQFFNSKSYWRSTDREAPHNVYTSFEKLDALNASSGYLASDFIGFTHVDGKPSKTPTATNINVNISSDTFNSSYIYDPTTNKYARSQDGAPHLDREGGQITPSVVIAMYVDESRAGDYKNHEIITTIGTGNATIFQNGEVIEATWRKSSKVDQLVFTDISGTEISFVRGQKWITAVPNSGGSVNYTAPAPVAPAATTE